MFQLSSADPEGNSLIDSLLAELLDRERPLVQRAAAFIALSEIVEAARAAGRTTFIIAGAITMEPEILIIDLLDLSLPPAVRTAAQHQQRLDAASN